MADFYLGSLQMVQEPRNIFISVNTAFVCSQNSIMVQGDPNQNLKFLLAVPLKQRISDPMLAKPKCV